MNCDQPSPSSCLKCDAVDTWPQIGISPSPFPRCPPLHPPPDFTIQQFQSVTQLHQIMLVVTIFFVVAFMMLLYRPYVKLLHEVAGAGRGVGVEWGQAPQGQGVESHPGCAGLGERGPFRTPLLGLL
jgi:hypothetical protein